METYLGYSWCCTGNCDYFRCLHEIRGENFERNSRLIRSDFSLVLYLLLAVASATAVEIFSSIRTVRSFTQEERMKENYSEEIEASYDAGKTYSIAYGVFIGLIGTHSRISELLIVWLIRTWVKCFSSIIPSFFIPLNASRVGPRCYCGGGVVWVYVGADWCNDARRSDFLSAVHTQHCLVCRFLIYVCWYAIEKKNHLILDLNRFWLNLNGTLCSVAHVGWIN